MSLIKRNTGSAFFRGLSSFWKRIFRDSIVLENLYSAAEVQFGELYLELMEAVLSKSIRSTPLFSKKDWKLALLNNTDLSFDPAVYSVATSTVLGPELSVTALELASRHDEAVLEFFDAPNMTPEKIDTYPTYGVFNVGLVSGILDRDNVWTVVIPTGKTIRDSLRDVNQRVVSNKRITSFAITAKNSVQTLPVSTRKILQSIAGWDASTNLPPVPAASELNEGYYYTVTTAGTTPLDGTASWAVGDWVVSDGTKWVKAALEAPTINFKVGDDFTGSIVLPPAVYTDLAAIKTALDVAIASVAASLPFPLVLLTEIDGGRLLFKSSKDLVVWDSNTAFESQLYVKEFRFKIKAEIPPGREDSLFWVQNKPIQMITSGYAPAGTEYRFPIDPKIKEAKYIYNTLYDPSVVLEQTRHFRLGGGYIYFKDNPFSFSGVAFRDFGDGRRQLALWMGMVSTDSLTLYVNYGYRFTNVKESSEAYRNFIQGIYYYYTHGPQVARLKSAFNILAGIPVATENDELVLSVSPSGLQVITDQHEYELPMGAPATVVPGDVLQAFDALTDAFKVEDYVSNPNWYDRMVIPDFLMPEARIGLRVSTVTTFIPIVGDPGYIVGDVTTDAKELVTDVIAPAVDYSLATEGYFEFEKDNNSKKFKITVPTAITTGAATIEDMAAYLRRALRQFSSNTVDGAGPSLFSLGNDAKFKITYLGVTSQVTITAASTAGASTLADLATAVQAGIDAAIGGGLVEVYQLLSTNSLVWIPTSNNTLTISDPNVAATDELGVYPFTSLSGAVVEVRDASRLAFYSTTVGSSSRVDITQINLSALSGFSMEPFRQGSGDVVGNDGDPSPGWDIMDKYLKFNLFKISYDANIIKFDEDVISIQDIVLSGRPLYTSAIIAPEFSMQDYVEGSAADGVYDPAAYLATISLDDVQIVDIIARKKASVFLGQPYAQLYRRDTATVFDYKTLSSVYAEVEFSGVSTDGGVFRVQSSDPGLSKINHVIELTDIDNRKLADQALFSTVGVFNRGKTANGITIPTTLIPAASVGGIYPAHLFGDATYGHWVTGFDRAAFPSNATHVFIIDAAMKAAGIDPLGSGLKSGDFMTLNNFADGTNSGKFSMLKLYRDVHYRGQYSGPNKVLVDMVVYRNDFATSTSENFFESTIPVAANASFTSNGNPSNNTWMIILPSAGTVSARLAGLLAATGDDKAEFPFDLSYVPALIDAETWVPPSVGTYYTGFTFDGDADNETYHASLFKISYDDSLAHDDLEAQLIDGGGSLPHGWTLENYSAILIRGGQNWGREYYNYDSDEIGPVSRNAGTLASPYPVYTDPAGAVVYADYDYATKLDNPAFVKFGEVTFFRGIQYHFTQLAPTDKAEYYGPHPTQVLPLTPTPSRTWPAGNTSTYRSYNWKGRWLPRFNLLASYNFTNPNMLVIGGGSGPGNAAPVGYTIGDANTLWTLQIGMPLESQPATSLPSPSGRENDLYEVMLPSDVVYPQVNAPTVPGQHLFEHGDWIYSDGATWQLVRTRGTQAELTTFALFKRLFDIETTGEHVTDPFAGVVGGGWISCHTSSHNYRIWADGSRWTKMVGGSVYGDLVQGGWYDFCGPQKLRGYGPTALTEHSAQLPSVAAIEGSSVFDWSQDPGYPGPHRPLVRVYDPGSSEIRIYFQIDESALEVHGVTFSAAVGVGLVNSNSAIRLHYYNVNTQNWLPPTYAEIPGSQVTGEAFTLKLVESPGGGRRLRLWNAEHPAAHDSWPFDYESGEVDPAVQTFHQPGKVLISLRVNAVAPYSGITNYFNGLVLERERVPVLRA